MVYLHSYTILLVIVINILLNIDNYCQQTQQYLTNAYKKKENIKKKNILINNELRAIMYWFST